MIAYLTSRTNSPSEHGVRTRTRYRTGTNRGFVERRTRKSALRPSAARTVRRRREEEIGVGPYKGFVGTGSVAGDVLPAQAVRRNGSTHCVLIYTLGESIFLSFFSRSLSLLGAAFIFLRTGIEYTRVRPQPPPYTRGVQYTGRREKERTRKGVLAAGLPTKFNKLIGTHTASHQEYTGRKSAAAGPTREIISFRRRPRFWPLRVGRLRCVERNRESGGKLEIEDVSPPHGGDFSNARVLATGSWGCN